MLASIGSGFRDRSHYCGDARVYFAFEMVLPGSMNPKWRFQPATPQLPFKRPQTPSDRDHKALNRDTLAGLGKIRGTCLGVPIWTFRCNSVLGLILFLG